MPKETKRFINPLLRPSQAVEQRQEAPTRARETAKPSVKTIRETVSPEQAYRVEPIEAVEEPIVQPEEEIVTGEPTSPVTPSAAVDQTPTVEAPVVPLAAQPVVDEIVTFPEINKNEDAGDDEEEKSSAVTSSPRKKERARTGGRRRQGLQTFESTHERITLWVDRHLRQSFEELAYKREMSKASLLNEAINDLLRKYSI